MARILVVDDSRSIREFIVSILQESGHKVVGAKDGVDGLSHADAGTYDLVVTDWNMPRMNGLEFVQNLRSKKRFADKPILVLTTESDQKKKDAMKDLGVVGWGHKPLDPQAFMKTVNRVLARFKLL